MPQEVAGGVHRSMPPGVAMGALPLDNAPECLCIHVPLREEGARLEKHLAMLEALREVRRRVADWTSGADLHAMYGIPL